MTKTIHFLLTLTIMLLVVAFFTADLFITREKKAQIVYPFDFNPATWHPFIPNTRYQQTLTLTHPQLIALELAIAATSSARTIPNGSLTVVISSVTFSSPVVAEFPLKDIFSLKVLRLDVSALTSQFRVKDQLTLDFLLNAPKNQTFGYFTAPNPALSRPAFSGQLLINQNSAADPLLFRPVYRDVNSIKDTDVFIWSQEIKFLKQSLQSFQPGYVSLISFGLFILAFCSLALFLYFFVSYILTLSPYSSTLTAGLSFGLLILLTLIS